MQVWKDSAEAWEAGLEYQENRDFEAAAQAYRYAAERGHALAQLNLGHLLDELLTPSNLAEALYWYEQAAENGEGAAAWNLAVHFRETRNSRLHRHWLKRAAQLGDEDARRAVGGSDAWVQ